MREKLLVLGLSLFLVGCSNVETKSDSSTQSSISSTRIREKESSQNDMQILQSTVSDYTDKNFVESGKLLEKGQWKFDESTGGKTELIDIIDSEQEIVLINGFKVVINNIKLLKTTDASIDYIKEFGVPDQFLDGNSYETLQIDYSVLNETDQEIHFRGFQFVTTDQRQQISVSQENIAGFSNEYVFLPQTDTLNEGLIFFLNAGTVNDIKSISIKTYDISDSEFKTIGDPLTFDLKF